MLSQPLSPEPPLLGRLQTLCRGAELPGLAARLGELADLVAADLVAVERGLPRTRPEASAVERSAGHLLSLGGKRLRPMCVALAARLGTGFDARAAELAVAAELIHAATLLHDDVVDLGESRRGAPTSRLLFGNAVSIFAGDWLLVDALRRVRNAGVEGLLERLFDVLDQMILAESLQLERRGRLDTTAAQWMAIAEGKTAALFRWAMYAGARSGGVDPGTAEVLERFGADLGVAFQATDDVLDLAGDPQRTGKALFTDLREGKLTYPLILSLERDPALAPLVADIVSAEVPDAAACLDALRRIEATGSLEDARRLAHRHAGRAKAALLALPPSAAREALETVADATVHRPV
ncbi:MAG: polyprenyl synthetase family protein [Sandaracinaceae bacterium]|nr:polyprenyl synthetase family protein [Sandaracinaceae bacterium]